MERSLLVPIRGADGEVPLPDDLTADDVVGAPSDPVVPVTIRADEGERLLAFTSIHRLRAWRPSARFITFPERDLQPLARRLGAHGVLIDATGPEIASAEGVSPAARPGEQWDVRGLAGPLDPRALYRLRARLRGVASVRRAYLVEVHLGRGAVLVMAVETEGLTQEAARRAVSALANELVGLLPTSFYVGVQFTLLGEDDFGASVRSADRPVYDRGERPRPR